MLCRNLVPRTDDAALQERERGFNAVRRDVAVNVNPGPMSNGLMWHVAVSRHLDRPGGCPKFVGHDDFYILADVFFDVLRQRPSLRVFSVEEAEFSATLLYPD